MCQVKSVHPALIAIWPPNNADPSGPNAPTSKPAGPEMTGGHCQRTLAAGWMDACLESEAVNCKHKAKI
ncbi:hypothetical protein DPMN_070575 [Dreissena polymorpha]|uniref:Uncharacterized protein n=1 Tax=Dreissena polymorpha TaxID=45954 RepID=A0A9D3Z183_DREPO|nr:hypothetical protein DPMN_070575 [Dreissena polymorpha]